MTYVGHTIAGAAVGVLCEPRRGSLKRRLLHYAVFVLVANLPDLPVRYWGHDRYDISHSIVVASAVFAGAAIALVISRTALVKIGGWRTYRFTAIAWLSHLILDSLYNHGHGVAIFWPVSEARLVLPIPWFSIVNPVRLSAEVLREYAVEAASFLPLLLLAVLARGAAEARRGARSKAAEGPF